MGEDRGPGALYWSAGTEGSVSVEQWGVRALYGSETGRCTAWGCLGGRGRWRRRGWVVGLMVRVAEVADLPGVMAYGQPPHEAKFYLVA